tara:strand:+ start:360 stop:551 length:192 start_codon:yes stop_codon:yes gene_type:complete
MTTSTIILVLGILVSIEGLFVIIFPSKTRIFLAKLAKKSTNLKSVGLIELIIGIALIVIAKLM